MGYGTILVVEANPGALVVARNVLTRHGHTVHTTSDPDEGRTIAATHDPDLLLLDAAFAWPEVLDDFARIGAVPMPVLVTVPSGMADLILDDLREEGAQTVVGAIEKPFVTDRLVEEIGEILIDHRHTRPVSIRGTPRTVPVVVDVRRATPMPVEASVRVLDPSEHGPTYQETLDAEQACEVLGVRSIDELHGALGEHATRSIEPLMTGRIGDVSVAHLLQFAEGLSGAIVCTLTRNNERIDITLHERHVVFAQRRWPEVDPDDGPDVVRRVQSLVYEALGWSDGRFTVRKRSAMPVRSVELPLAGVLLEGLRQQDEWGDNTDHDIRLHH